MSIPFESGRDHAPRSQRGQGLAEYVLMLVLIVVVAIVALFALGGEMSEILATIGESV